MLLGEVEMDAGENFGEGVPEFPQRRVIVGGGTREARLTVISRASGPRTVTLRW